MSEIRELIAELVAMGVDTMDAAEIITRAAIAGAAKAPRRASTGAERQARYRARQKFKQSSDPRMAAFERARDGARNTLEAMKT